MNQDDLRFFDRDEDFCVFEERALPHWMQAGTLCFITWRLHDALPGEVYDRIDREVASLLKSHTIACDETWSEYLSKLDLKTRSQMQWKLFMIRDKFLDQGWGRCPLREPQHAEIVLNSLRHFDEDRYFLTDVAVMPNHLHFIAAFQSQDAMLTQCEAWKRFTGRTVHRMEGRRGEFWQVDQFDHLIRSEAQFSHFKKYIADNPSQAGLSEGDFLHFHKPLQVE
ncbi:hypothetical protein [Allorhodopirellula heiligendammensis]|uniref:Transposase IS200-like domain-containing protein n=1 Tax=Allorhodopirellula heiligendammensis TaxID=2714739 RepID=A0A5C6BW02_9BACT|nr:hypothetical protein [Allorhodopirellula heiligendammensis]TWU15406.1 hypothetical protein Poly21_26010 [Allorhodopirellula heiligendammensis]